MFPDPTQISIFLGLVLILLIAVAELNANSCLILCQCSRGTFSIKVWKMKNHRKREKCCVAYPLSLNCIQVKFLDYIQDCEGLDWMHNCTIRAGFATLQNVILLSDHLSFIWNSEEHSNLSCGWVGWVWSICQWPLTSANKWFELTKNPIVLNSERKI